MKTEQTAFERLRTALGADSPGEELRKVAGELQEEGLSAQEQLAMFDRLREEEPASSDPELQDMLMELMDRIVGWCPPDQGVYPPEGN